MAVEKVGQDESKRRFVTCKKCGAKLAYYPRDVREEMTIGCDDSTSIEVFVVCSECGNRIGARR